VNATPSRAGRLAVGLVLILLGAAAQAGGNHAGSHGHGSNAAIGTPGRPAQVSRTVEVSMNDSYFEPESIRVEAGETVRFVIRNEGELVHEFNIGTPEMHAAHQEEMLAMMRHGVLLADRIDHERMRKDMGGGQTMMHAMRHDDPNSVLLEPGQSGELVWRFATGGDLEFACNVPGHYAAGMVGAFRVE